VIREERDLDFEQFMGMIVGKDLIGEVENIFEELAVELGNKYVDPKGRNSSRKGYKGFLRDSSRKGKRSASKPKPNSLFNESVKKMHRKFITNENPEGDSVGLDPIGREREYITPRYRNI